MSSVKGQGLLIISAAERSDARSIERLAIETNIDAWSESDYFDEIGRPGSLVLKAVKDGSIQGFLVARIVPGSSNAPDIEIYNIAVSPNVRRDGVGSQLLSELFSRLAQHGVESCWLEVRESNLAAVRFYEKTGFQAEVTRPNFYGNPTENAVIMRLRMSTAEGVGEPSRMLDSRFEEE
ncbi:MAG: ribosomal protein S18-alanine N-acetyltransferase [Pyrinomonadaceae bacterium]